MGLQAFWAIALARAIGPSGYGLFAGLAGLATTFGSLSGFGFGLLMLQSASRNPDNLRQSLSNALLAICISGFILTTAYLVFAQHVVNQNIGQLMLLSIAIPELFCLPATLLASYAFQSRDRMGWAGAMYAIGPMGNVIAFLMYWLSNGQNSIESYLKWHAWTALASGLVSILLVLIVLKPGIKKPGITMADTREAAGFTTLRLVDTGLASIDKSLVLKFLGSEAAGHYTAAYRLAALIALPAISLGISVAPRLFRMAESNESRKLLVSRLLGIGLIFSLTSIPIAWFGSKAIPVLFGQEFIDSAETSREMLLLPAFLGLASLGCTVLMAIGGKKERTHLQTVILLILAALMYSLTPWQGLAGAAVAIQVTYALLALSTWWFIISRGSIREG